MPQVTVRGQQVQLEPVPLVVGGVPVWDVRDLFPDDALWQSAVRKRGLVVHHDAVSPGADSTPTGDLQQAVDRLGAIWEFHRSKGWNGIGYHFLIDDAGRVWYAGDLSTHRAHTSGWDSTVGATLNETQVGICFMGHFGDGVDYNGSAVEPLGDRPTPEAITDFKELCSNIADRLAFEYDRPTIALELHPHKFWQTDTACPGTWAPRLSWADITISGEKDRAPEDRQGTGLPPAQDSQPTPEAEPARILAARRIRDMAGAIDGLGTAMRDVADFVEAG